MGDLTHNFSKSEFECRCGCEMPEYILTNIQELADNLQVIRDVLNTPITVNSGYRCPEYNQSIGGASKSQHKLGRAADIVSDGTSPEYLQDMIEQMMVNGEIINGGLGRYSQFTHYDIRDRSARW